MVAAARLDGHRSVAWVYRLSASPRSLATLGGSPRSRMGPMASLLIVLPALLISLGTVVLVAREERALAGPPSLRH